MQFTQGLDLRTDTTQASAPSLVRAENVYFDRESSFRKRFGFRVLPKTTSTGGTITRATSLAGYRNELLLFDDTYLYSWSVGQQTWVQRDVAIPTQVKQFGVPVNSTTAPYFVRSATCDFWKTSNGISIVDTATQALIANVAQSGIVVVRTQSGAMALNYSPTLQITPLYSNGTAGAPITLCTSCTLADAAFDGVNVVIAYQDLTTSNKAVVVAAYTDTGAVSQTYARNVIDMGGAARSYMAVAANPNKPGMAYVAVNNEVFRYTDLTQITTKVTGAPNYTLSNSNYNFVGAMTDDGASADFAVSSGNTTTMNTVGATTAYAALTGFTGVTGPFRRNGHVYSWVGYFQTTGVPQFPLPTSGQSFSNTKQTVAVLYNWTLQRFVAKLGYGAINYGAVRLPVALSADTYGFGISRSVALQSVAGQAVGGAATLTTVVSPYLATVRFSQSNEQQSARIGATLFCANGLPFSYDGAQTTEHGFTLAPEIVALQETASTPTFPAGTRLYVAVYEWTDAQGQLYRSAPSAPFSYTRATAAATQPILTFNPLYLTSKANVTIAFYKTVASGTLYFRCGTTTAVGAVVGSTPNAWLDNNDSDATLQGGALLYTVGGELPNDAPPACTLVSTANQRLFVAGGEDENVITYSKQAVVNAGVGFSLALTQRIDTLPGPITAVEHLDDKHFVWKKDNIFYWSGQGPTPNGANSDYTSLQMLSNGIGCISIQSLVRTPGALLFQHTRGMYSLGRDLSLTNVGAPIGPLNSNAFTSAILVPGQAHVRFGSASADALVYSYEALSQYAAHNNVVAGQWTTFRNYTQTDACLWNATTYVFCRLDGTVCVESADWSDNGTSIPMVIQTGWIRPAGPIEGGEFYELGILGLWRGAHTLTVDQMCDYGTATLGTLTFSAGAAVAGTPWGVDPKWGGWSPWGGDGDTAYALRGVMPLSSPAVGALQVRLSDAAVPGQTLGDSVTLNALTIMTSTDGQLLRAPQKKFAG